MQYANLQYFWKQFGYRGLKITIHFGRFDSVISDVKKIHINLQ